MAPPGPPLTGPPSVRGSRRETGSTSSPRTTERTTRELLVDIGRGRGGTGGLSCAPGPTAQTSPKESVSVTLSAPGGVGRRPLEKGLWYP